MRLKIGVPTRDQVEAAFAYSLANMMADMGRGGLDVGLELCSGTLICSQREQLADKALAQEADWILFLDSDMIFPVDLAARLLAHEAPIVGVNYPTRRAPCQPTAYKSVKTRERLYTGPESAGLEEVSAVGMGCFLVHMDVFRAMSKPWFLIPYLPEVQGYVGEDVWFANQARKVGFPTLIDHDLSREVKHIGRRDYDWQDAWAIKDDLP